MQNRRLLTAAQAKELDVKLKDRLGINTLILMENAGRAVAEEAFKMLRQKKQPVAVFCGKGNNGGDGFVAARHLLAQGIKPDIFLAGKISGVRNEARVNLDIARKLKQRVLEIEERRLPLVKSKIPKYALIIDALLGVGLKGEIRGIYRDLIGVINAAQGAVLSVDIPSGLDATSGKVLGCCVEADKTVTFMAKKRGMVFGAGPGYCGEIIVRQLGAPL